MAIVNPQVEKRAARRAHLNGLSKARVIQVWYHARPNAETARPVGTWMKDEIIADILEAEFGGVFLCGEKDPETGAYCSITANTGHVDHRFSIPAETELQPAPTGFELTERLDAIEEKNRPRPETRAAAAEIGDGGWVSGTCAQAEPNTPNPWEDFEHAKAEISKHLPALLAVISKPEALDVLATLLNEALLDGGTD